MVCPAVRRAFFGCDARHNTTSDDPTAGTDYHPARSERCDRPRWPARFCRCSNSIRTEDAAAAEKAPVVDKANDAGPQPDEVSGKRGLTPNCEKELRRTADLLRFFANRIQTGEETQSVVADVTQQEKRITAVCPD